MHNTNAHMPRLPNMMAFLLAAGCVSASIQLDIPPREQWDNSNGYCGECSIQQAALYYGTYISQYRAREIIDPTQRQDLWVPDHSGQVFDALRLNYQDWNSSAAQPQYQAYLIWTKAHLQQGHPVIITVFVKNGDYNDYDHIIPATGFTSLTTNSYIASDTLTFSDNYEQNPYTRTFDTLWATRTEADSGVYEYYIPKNIDYGCAVTGVKDSSGTLLPLSLKLNRWNEPNISLGAAAVTMTATIRVRALTTGNSYALLRYNTYSSVPTSGYLSSAYSSLTVFTATNTTHNLTDSFLSDKIVIYRCVPNTTAAPEMDVRGNAVSVTDGDATPSAADHTDFGSALVAGGTVTRTFTVYNTGAAALNLTGAPKVAVGGTHAAEFNVTLLPASPVAANSGTTTFQVTFDPAAAGTRSATLSLASNDADENPYNFSIQGAGTTASAPETEMQTPLLVANDRAVLRWASVSSSLYTVHRSTNLVSGFSVLTNHIPATPPVNTHTDTLNSANMRFWKISKE